MPTGYLYLNFAGPHLGYEAKTCQRDSVSAGGGMVNTFLAGLSKQSYQSSGEICATHMRKAIKDAKPTATEDEINQIVFDNTASFKQEFLRKSRSDNYFPLTRIVATLPIEDMAHLAETLVSLESLKEKVTTPTESVSGPIDVAIITKHEGLVWIKRKHYFTPELNRRYFDTRT